MNENWPRWIFASLSKWFESQRASIPFFVEGEDKSKQVNENYFEFRMNGPTTTEKSAGWWKLEVVVNVLIVAKQTKTNFHTVHNLVGVAGKAFAKCIPIYKYGANVGVDDSSFLGVMVLKEFQGEAIQITHLGQVSPDTKEMQSMVQGYYCMNLEV